MYAGVGGMADLIHLLRRFSGSRQGTIAVLFAITGFLVVVSIGLAIDGARAYSASSRVAAALDAAALAAAKMLDDESYSDADIQERAQRFFSAHMSAAVMHGLTVPAPTTRIDRASNEVELSTNVSLVTTFAQLAGVETFQFPRSSKVAYDMRRIELAMVLDITGSMCAPCTKIDDLKLAAKDVVQTMITNDTPYGYVRIGVVPYSASVNAGPFAGPATVGASTDGCTVERSGPQAYTDAPPSSVNPLGAASSGTNPQYSCPSTQLLPMSADKLELTNVIDSLSANGATAGHIGLGWGWYMVSPNWASFWPLNSRPRTPAPNVVKAVLLMTDGMFNTSYIPGAGMNATDPAIADSPGYQALQLCDSMRAQNIAIYAVAFQAPPEAEAMLRACVSSGSNFFPAENGTDLRNAFREIANRLTALRVKS